MHDNAYTDLSKLCIWPTVEYENKMQSRKLKKKKKRIKQTNKQKKNKQEMIEIKDMN